MGTSLTKFRLFLPKASFIINTLFPPLRETLYAGRVKLFAEALLGLPPMSISPLLKRRT
jgi:hypothetical protein